MIESLTTLGPPLPRETYQLYLSNPSLLPDPALRQAVSSLATERTTLVRVVSRYSSFSPQARALVEKVRSLQPGGDLRLQVGGSTASFLDTNRYLYRNFPLVFFVVVAAIYLSLLLLFRSVVIPLKAVSMNTLSILASYGALVYIFQDGHLSWLLRFSSEGFIEQVIPILLFCILFGLSMDYEVFLLSRIKEAYDNTGDNSRSVGLGLERTGRLITSAAAVLILVAASFATADIVMIKSLGVGLAIAILVDATVVRALLVPATMRLLGSWNWWAPGFIRGKGSGRRPGSPAGGPGG